MGTESKEVETYSIVAYPGPELPEQYRPMVMTQWLRSMRKYNDIFKSVPSEIYYKNYDPFLKMLMSKPGSIVKLAVLTDDQDVVLGFSVSREDVLDYVYVQKDSRGKGFATKLVPRGITTFSHRTRGGDLIWQRDDGKYKHLKFNPFA